MHRTTRALVLEALWAGTNNIARTLTTSVTARSSLSVKARCPPLAQIPLRAGEVIIFSVLSSFRFANLPLQHSLLTLNTLHLRKQAITYDIEAAADTLPCP